VFCRGWINALTVIGKSLAAGLVMMVIALLFSICAAMEVIMLVKVGQCV